MSSDMPIDYEAHWATSLDTYKNHPTSRHRRRFVLSSLRTFPLTKESFVFDYGCGAGIILSEIKALFGLRDEQLGGCDVSKEGIAHARATLRTPYLFEQPFPSLPNACDVIVCTEVIEHTKDYEEILRWIWDHLSAGGMLVLSTPGVPMDPPDQYYGHIQHFRIKELKSTLEGIGYEVPWARLWGFPLFTLQKWVTNRHFDRVKSGYMSGGLTAKKRLIFNLAYYLYFVHDLISLGPQIFIRARKPRP